MYWCSITEKPCAVVQEVWQKAQDACMADAIKAAVGVKDTKSDAAKDLQARVKLLEVRVDLVYLLNLPP